MAELQNGSDVGLNGAFTIKEIVIETNRKVDRLIEGFGKVEVLATTSISNVEKIADHEVRLRSVERFKNAVPSVAVLGLLVSVAATVIALAH